jgi:sugar diacid utilization regulator
VDNLFSPALHRLLQGENVDNVTLQKEIQPFGWKLHHSYQIAIIKPEDSESCELFLLERLFYFFMLSTLYPASKLLIFEDKIVMVGNYTLFEKGLLDFTASEKLRNFLYSSDTVLRASSKFSWLPDAGVYYRQAKFIATKPDSSDSRIMEYSTYIADHLVSSFARTHHSQYYLHPDVTRLAEYDSEHNNDLLFTWYIYLLNDRSYQRCASKYYLHRNTMIYRLRKINDLIQRDPDDENTRLSILISIKMYWHMHPRQAKPEQFSTK